jgi:CcmD family protein
MDKLTYATIVIMVIWGGVFFYLFTLDRRLRRLEKSAGSEAAPE